MRRPSARQRGYTSEWDKAAKEFLQAHPYCVMCLEFGQQKNATAVTHKLPHRGNPALFWNPKNWQGLCAGHHSGAGSQVEQVGHLDAMGVE